MKRKSNVTNTFVIIFCHVFGGVLVFFNRFIHSLVSGMVHFGFGMFRAKQVRIRSVLGK